MASTSGEGHSNIWSDICILRSICERGDVEELERFLLHCKQNIFTTHMLDGNSFLHFAAKSGSAECVRLLLNRYDKADMKSNEMDTPLHFAVMSGSLDCVRILLQAGAKVFENNRKQNTPLHLAAEMGFSECVKILIDNVSDNSSIRVETQINSPNSNMRTPLHLAAQSGSLKCVELLVEHKSNVSLTDYCSNTPLHCAALSGSLDCVKFLVQNGANLLSLNKDKLTPISLILTNPDGEYLLRKILDDCIRVESSEKGIEELEINLKVLCPNDEKNKMAVPNRLYSSHRDNKRLLLHPLLKAVVCMEWNKSKYIIWYRFTAYLLYLLVLTIYISTPPENVLSLITRVSTGFLSGHVMLFCIPYLFPGQYSLFRRITKTMITVIPPILSLVTISIPYNPEWCGISFLSSWLCMPFYTSAIAYISQQTGMFIYVTKEIVKHSLVFLFVVVGFALAFFVLYYDKDNQGFSSFWHAFLYTILVLLQGDGLGEFPIFGEGTFVNSTELPTGGYYTYVTQALSSMRFASIVASLLFVFVVIIALLNMLIALAVRGGDELVDYGQVYHLWSQAQLLYEWNEVKRFLKKVFRYKKPQTYENFSDQDYVTIKNTQLSLSLRHELRAAAKYKKIKKGDGLTLDAVEKLMEEKMSKIFCEIQDMKQNVTVGPTIEDRFVTGT